MKCYRITIINAPELGKSKLGGIEATIKSHGGRIIASNASDEKRLAYPLTCKEVEYTTGVFNELVVEFEDYEAVKECIKKWAAEDGIVRWRIL